MARNVPKRHQRSIIPQQRTQAGKYKPKPSARQPRTILKAQQLPTMMTSNNGAIGEM